MIVADELEADCAHVEIVQAGATSSHALRATDDSRQHQRQAGSLDELA